MATVVVAPVESITYTRGGSVHTTRQWPLSTTATPSRHTQLPRLHLPPSCTCKTLVSPTAA